MVLFEYIKYSRILLEKCGAWMLHSKAKENKFFVQATPNDHWRVVGLSHGFYKIVYKHLLDVQTTLVQQLAFLKAEYRLDQSCKSRVFAFIQGAYPI